jgi:hypothetical protein
MGGPHPSFVLSIRLVSSTRGSNSAAVQGRSNFHVAGLFDREALVPHA